MKFFKVIKTLATCIKTSNVIHLKIEAKGRNGETLKCRVATYLRAVGRGELKCEQSVIFIPLLENCDSFHELMYRM